MIALRNYDKDIDSGDVLFTDPTLLMSSLSATGVNWVNIEMQGADNDTVNILMDDFGIDDQFKNNINEMILKQSDVSEVPLAKFDAVKNYSLFRLNMLSLINCKSQDDADFSVKEIGKYIGKEQICIVGLHNTLISFQEGNIDGDVLNPVRHCIEKNKFQIREHRINHLFYHILEVILDEYFKIVSAIREQIDDLEEKQAQFSDERILMCEIMRLKKVLRFLRRETIHLKKAFDDLKKCENFFSDDDMTGIYSKTISEHLNELLSYYDNASEGLKDLIDLNISLSGAQMNRIMKTLTLVSAIFIPLTFIAGLYGMNFECMPELKWQYGYGIALAVMTGIATLTIWSLRKWF